MTGRSRLHSGKMRGENINLRAPRDQKALIDRAALAISRNRSAFMLESVCREAKAVCSTGAILLPGDEFKRLTAMLDKSPASNLRWARLLKTKAPWGK
jgi:uncharacterized protein (DUF1778 family)